MAEAPTTECQTVIVHDEVVRAVRETIPKDEELYDLSDFFRILGDATRMKILHALTVSEMCVCDLSVVLGATRSAVSHQLKTLRQARLVKYRREGKTVFYSLKDHHVQEIVAKGLEHVQE